MKPSPSASVEAPMDREDKRREAGKKNKIDCDWRLVAAVVDRICAITFAIVFVAGTLVFVVLFITHS